MVTGSSKNILQRLSGLRPLFILITIALLVFSCASSPTIESTHQLPLAADIVKGRLDNGLNYLIRPNAYPADRAILYLAVKAGSLNEDDDQQGLAHLLEHMAFNGTENFPEESLVSFLQSIGIRFGPEINAYTSFDRTVYTLEVPLDKADNLALALKVLDDWARRISFDPLEIAKEIDVVYEEYRLSRGVKDRLMQKHLPVLMQGSLFSLRMPIGKPEIFRQANQAKLLRFYQDWYRPENMTVIVVGDLDLKSTEKLIQTTFGGDFVNNPKRNDSNASLPLPQAGRFAFSAATDPELSSGYMQFLYKMPAVGARGDLEDYRRSTLLNLMIGAANARLDEKLLQAQAPFVQAGLSIQAFSRKHPFLGFVVVPKDGQSVEAIRSMVEFKEQLLRFGFTDSELEAQKAELLATIKNLLNEADKNESSQLADELLRHSLEGESVPGIAAEYELLQKILPSISKQQILDQLQKTLSIADITFLAALPESQAKDLPSEQQVKEIFIDVAKVQLQAPVEQITVESLLSHQPQRGQIVKEELLPASKTLRLNLSNGMVVYLKQTDFKNDEISLSGLAQGGTSTSSDQDFLSADYASGLAQYSGLASFDAAALNRYLKGKTLSIARNVGIYTHGINASATPADLKTLFELIYLYFTATKIEDEAMQVYLAPIASALANQENNPDSLFSLVLNEVMGSRHPRVLRRSLSDLDQVDPKKALKFLQSIFKPDGFTFALAGNLDLSVTKDLIERYLASIPAGKVPALHNLQIKGPKGGDTLVSKGSEARSLVYETWNINDSYSYQKFVFGRMLRELLDIRLNSSIRENMSGVYSIGAALGYQTLGASDLLLGISYGCDPQRIEEISAAIWKELESIQAGKIEASDFAKVKEILLHTWRADIRRNLTWTGLLTQLPLVRGADPESFVAYESILAAAKVEDLVTMANKFTKPQRNRIMLKPEK